MKSNEEIIRLINSLGNPNRLKLLNLLMTGVHCNCELAEQTGMAMNLISHHLKILQDLGLIKSERKPTDARWIYYSIDKERITAIQEQLQDFFNPERSLDRKPVCPPCKSKIKEKKDE